MRALTVAAVLMLAGLVLLGARAWPRVRDWLDCREAESLIRSGDYVRAATVSDGVLARSPNHPLALKLFEKAMDLRPDRIVSIPFTCGAPSPEEWNRRVEGPGR